MTATNDQISYAEFTLTVPANSSIPIERQSDFVACLGSTADFKIRLNNSPSAFFTAGLTVEPIGGLESVQVVNDTATPLTVTLAFGRGNIRDSRVTLNPTQILPTRESAPDLLISSVVNLGSAGYNTVAVANPLRREAVISNYSGQTIYIGGDNVNPGAQLLSGGILTLQTTAEIWSYNPGAATSIRLLSLEWSA